MKSVIRPVSKLSLNKQTLRTLSAAQLEQVGGASGSPACVVLATGGCATAGGCVPGGPASLIIVGPNCGPSAWTSLLTGGVFDPLG